MAPEPSRQMDPLQATSKVAKAILNAPTGNGRLIATILSAYDLPQPGDVPTSVSLSYNQPAHTVRTVRTGPPAAKHRDHANSFKFGSAVESNGNGESTGPNQLVVEAPLSVLFESELTFTLTFADASKNLTSNFLVSKSLRVNETQWLILYLDDTSLKSPLQSSQSTISSNTADKPTLRLKVRLEGPHRPEISAIIQLFNGWFHLVDVTTDAASHATSQVSKAVTPAFKMLLVPGVPIVAIAAVASPILIGVLILGIPVFLPVICLLFSAMVAIAAVGSGVVLSTRDGRTKIQNVAEPSYQSFLMTTIGQRVVYDVGPRPSPQALASAVLPEGMMGKLVVSLLVDFVGSASYLLPVVGEGFDLGWAPVSMVLVGAMYDGVLPNLKYVALMEELLPFTDVVPSASLGWMKEFGPGIVDEWRKKIQKGGGQGHVMVNSRR